MTDPNEFDPYHRWLGIRPEEQPADHYRRLALARFEDDPEVIRDAAERQMGHVRRYALGEHRKASQKILNELAAAKACLLDERKKAKYDEQLRERITAAEEEPLPIAEPDADASPPPARIPAMAVYGGEPSAFSKTVSGSPTGRRHRDALGRWASPTGIGAAVAGACILIVLALWTVAQRRPNAGDTEAVGPNVAGLTSKPPSADGKPESPSAPPKDTSLAFSWALSERDDARLWIDDDAKRLPEDGDEPLCFPVSPGKHTVKVERQGFEPIDVSDIQVSEGESTPVFLRWHPLPQEATVVFSWPPSERTNAALWIDGQPKSFADDGDVMLRFAVTPATHSIRVEREGFKPIVFSDVRFTEGESRILSLAWRPISTEPPLAVAPFDEAQARRHQSTWADHLGLDVEITNSIGMRLALIPPGEFTMGSPKSDAKACVWESPQHNVRITRPFYFGVYEVRQAEYENVMGTNPSYFKGADNPVEQLSWDDAVQFCKRLSAKEGRTYRLPTAAEWEYACRAGTRTRYSFRDDLASLKEYAWYMENSERKAHPVGERKPNAWGLRDMHGNVWEWCADWFDDYYAVSPTNDPPGPEVGVNRVSRGGGWRLDAGYCRSANRYGVSPSDRGYDLGFRVARSPSGESPSRVRP